MSSLWSATEDLLLSSFALLAQLAALPVLALAWVAAALAALGIRPYGPRLADAIKRPRVIAITGARCA